MKAVVLNIVTLATLMAVCGLMPCYHKVSAAQNHEQRLPSKEGTETKGTKGAVNGLADTALRWGHGAGTLAGKASVGTLVTTLKSLKFVAESLRYVLLPAPVGHEHSKVSSRPGAPILTPAGYSPVQSEVSCAHCGQKTIIRGNLLGRKVQCPSCGKELRDPSLRSG